MLTRKMKHTPHPSRRSVLAEIELRFAEHVEATAGHQFRHPDDISLLSSLQQYYAYLTGRAAPGEIKYMYTDLADPSTPFRLGRLLHDRHLDAFCLNDTDSDAAVGGRAGGAAGRLPARLPAVPVAVRAGDAAGRRPHAGAPRTPVVARQAAGRPPIRSTRTSRCRRSRHRPAIDSDRSAARRRASARLKEEIS